jgi:hypothetical protein
MPEYVSTPFITAYRATKAGMLLRTAINESTPMPLALLR